MSIILQNLHLAFMNSAPLIGATQLCATMFYQWCMPALEQNKQPKELTKQATNTWHSLLALSMVRSPDHSCSDDFCMYSDRSFYAYQEVPTWFKS